MFEPGIGPHGIGDLVFFYGTPEATDWYYPLKPYTKLEYLWVQEHIGPGEIVVDAGCHHGNYTVLFKHARQVIAIDNQRLCLDLALINTKLNGMRNVEFHRYTMGSLASIFSPLKIQLRPTVYKMDIEGAEFDLFPGELALFPEVHTWILELHPGAGEPRRILDWFDDQLWSGLLVDRETLTIHPIDKVQPWPTHQTVIFTREQ